jgi:CHAT domain-containing protein
MNESRPRACPGPETLGAFIEGNLSPDVLRETVAHIETCSACLSDLAEAAEFERTGDSEDEQPPETDRTHGRRAAITQALAAAIALIAIGGIVLVYQSASPRVTPPLASLTAAASRANDRPFEGRLAGFSWRPFSRPTRSTNDSVNASRLRTQAAAADIYERTALSSSVGDLHASGVAALIANHPHEAVDRLRKAATCATTVPTYWNDLAVAFLAVGRVDADAHAVAQALAAADRALSLDSTNAEALFNRAVALESLELHSEAAVAWKNCLAVDAISSWAVEARTRLARVQPVPDASKDWKASQPRLASAIDRDTASARKIVRTFNEEARKYGELVYANTWADAIAAKQYDIAGNQLQIMRLIGDELLSTTGESLLRDAVAAIDQCRNASCLNALSEAYRTYYRARKLHSEADPKAALMLFLRARDGFEASRSPMSWMCSYYIAACEFDLNLSERTHAASSELLDRIPPSYLALRAQLLWNLYAVESRRGQWVEGLKAARGAAEAFSRLREKKNLALMLGGQAAMRMRLGQQSEAWQLWPRVFSTIEATGDAGEMQRMLELAGRMEAMSDNWSTAAALFRVASEDRLRIKKRLHLSVLVWQALALDRLDRHQDALKTLDVARTHVAELPTSQRDTASDDIHFAAALVLRSTNPSHAAELLDSYIARGHLAQRGFLLPEAHLQRARVASSLGNYEEAISHLYSALESVRERHPLSNAEIAEAYFATENDAAAELAALLVDRGATAAAFEVIDGVRERAFISDETLSRKDRPIEVPTGTVLLEFLAQTDRLNVFILRSGEQIAVLQISVGLAALRSAIGKLNDAVEDKRDTDAIAIASRLSQLLIEPLRPYLADAQEIVIIADRGLESLPFAVLSLDGRYLPKDFVITYSPSAASFSRSVHVRPPSTVPGHTIIVGDPAFDAAIYPRLPRLPGAAKEARLVAAHYDDNTSLLSGRDATRGRIVKELSSATVAHIATHSIVDRRRSMRSHLVLAPGEQGNGALYGFEIAAMDLPLLRLVLLTGCRTAREVEAPSAVRSLAQAFLAAGASAVVGSVCDLPDDSAAMFASSLHQQFARHANAPAALREVQRTLMDGRPFVDWAPYQVVVGNRGSRPSSE